MPNYKNLIKGLSKKDSHQVNYLRIKNELSEMLLPGMIKNKIINFSLLML
jgi:hypothetical protein